MLRCSAGTIFFFFNDTATTEIYTLSLHDALPICRFPVRLKVNVVGIADARRVRRVAHPVGVRDFLPVRGHRRGVAAHDRGLASRYSPRTGTSRLPSAIHPASPPCATSHHPPSPATPHSRP